MVEWLIRAGSLAEKSIGRVCNAFNVCKDVTMRHRNIGMSFHDYVNNDNSSIVFPASILDMNNIDLVICFPTTVRYHLTSRMLEARVSKEDSLQSSESCADTPEPVSTTADTSNPGDGGHHVEALPRKNKAEPRHPQSSTQSSGQHEAKASRCIGNFTDCELSAMRVHKSQLLDSEPKAKEIPEPHTLDLSDLTAEAGSGTVLPGDEQSHGPEPLRRAIRDLCRNSTRRACESNALTPKDGERKTMEDPSFETRGETPRAAQAC